MHSGSTRSRARWIFYSYFFFLTRVVLIYFYRHEIMIIFLILWITLHKNISQTRHVSNFSCTITWFSFSGYRAEFLKALSVIGNSPSNGEFIDSCYLHCQTELQELWQWSDSPSLANTVRAFTHPTKKNKISWVFNQNSLLPL